MAKSPRRKGMRTAYLKSYSARYISTGTAPNPMYMDEWYDRQKNGRSNPLHVGPGTHKQMEEEKPWQGVRFQGIERFNGVCIQSGKVVRRWYYFSGQRHFFIEQDLILEKEKRSIVYPSKSIAFGAHTRDSICWIEHSSINK